MKLSLESVGAVLFDGPRACGTPEPDAFTNTGALAKWCRKHRGHAGRFKCCNHARSVAERAQPPLFGGSRGAGRLPETLHASLRSSMRFARDYIENIAHADLSQLRADFAPERNLLRAAQRRMKTAPKFLAIITGCEKKFTLPSGVHVVPLALLSPVRE